MKLFSQNLVIFTLIGLLSVTSTARAEEPANGTILSVRAVGSVSSETSVQNPNQTTFVVARDVMGPKGGVAIKAGTPVVAAIATNKLRRIGRPGSVEVTLQNTQSASGKTVTLISNSYKVEGKSKKIKSIVLSVFFTPLILLMRGGEATLPAGTELSATVIN